jgi:hypothetical protein
MAAPTVIIKPRYVQTIGSISAINTPLPFGVSDLSQAYRGQLTLTGASTGAVSTPTWVLEGSIDNGSTWFVIPAQTTLPIALTGQMTGDTAPLFALQYNISGLGGALFHFGLSAGTGITAFTVSAYIG